jgi:phosphatidylglycerol---prolipoprotein diacylglyceryl transferase
MNPIAFSILGVDIRWYGILIAAGMLLGILITKYTCSIKNISYDSFIDILLISIPIGIIGARIYYVLFEFPYYAAHPEDILNIRQGGLAIHGAIIFGLLSGLIMVKRKNLTFLSVADAAVPGLILAQAIGRWGNFFNQEAHGGPVSADFIKFFPEFIQKGMYIDGTYYHPTFLYESIWNLLVFVILMLIINRFSSKDGLTLFSYLGLYSLGRFFIEGLRTDSLMIGPFRVAQLVSLIGILICILFIYYKNKKRTFYI